MGHDQEAALSEPDLSLNFPVQLPVSPENG